MKLLLKRIFDANFFLSNVLVPLIALALYCGSFAYLSSHFLVQGVNYFFVTKFGKYLWILIGGALVIFFGILTIKPGNKLSFQNPFEKLHAGDFLLLLLPLTPVAQYILTNQDVLSLRDTLTMLILFAIFSGIYALVIPALLGIFIPTRTLMILGLAFVFTIISMSSISNYFKWFEKGALLKQLIVLGCVFLVVWFFYILDQRKVLYILIAANFILNSSIQLWQRSTNNVTATSMQENKLLTLVGKKKPVVTPNIYLLIYDAYVPNETMLAYGIDNRAQEKYLTDQGFQLYPHTYSIASSTLATMTRVLNASTEFYGSARTGVSGNGVGQKLLKNVGYKTYGLFFSDFMFSGAKSHYDYSIPDKVVPAYSGLVKAILVGEFRFNIENEGIGAPDHNQFVEAKQHVFANIHGQPAFIYMHTNLPAHSQTSGACRTDETDQFKERLRRANIEMKDDLNLIIKNDPGAIIIVAGDHGPYLTKNCASTTGVYKMSEISRADIQDRYGTFLAIRWPTGDYKKYDDVTVLQDLFPAIFAYLYQDPALLQSKIEPVIPAESHNSISGASVDHGTIRGGINDGEPLFLSGK